MENYLEDDKVYVLDRDEVLLTVFDKDDEDTIINPNIKETQNAEAVFTFSISPNNPKWKQINNPENLYVANGKVFSTNFEGCFNEIVSENNEDLIEVTAYERQKLLSRKYVRAWNSETGFESIDTFMVVVLSNGNLPLKNNDAEVTTAHLPGTSGYALDALLYGTGWTTGICDVEGTFDLETDQVDIYENILKIQQIWGGILVFDSVNKTVSHRDETNFLPYNGYEVRYQKNMQSLEKLYNNKIITKLCPLGEGGLNIKSVNNGSEWLTNYTYTNSVLEGIENNPDIYEPDQLKRWGQRKLQDLCKPRKELTVKAILLHQVEGYELETVGLNDIVDVINYADVEGEVEQLRVVGFEYKIWDLSDAILDLSDITLDSTDIFKKNVQATNNINDGTLSANKVVNFFRSGETLNQTINFIDKTVTDTYYDVYDENGIIHSTFNEIKTDYNQLNGEVVSQRQLITDIQASIRGLEVGIFSSGGDNLLRNSVGYFNNATNRTLEYWEGHALSYTDDDVQRNNISDNAIYLQQGSIMQEVLYLKNGEYNLSFNFKKTANLATITLKINNETYNLASGEPYVTPNSGEGWYSFEKVVTINGSALDITFTSTDNNSCYIGDLLLIFGMYRQTWTQNANETTTDTVQIGKGIQVNSSTKNTYARFDADGNRIINKETSRIVTELTDKGVRSNFFGPMVDEDGKLILDENDNPIYNSAEIGGILIQETDGQTWISSLI